MNWQGINSGVEICCLQEAPGSTNTTGGQTIFISCLFVWDDLGSNFFSQWKYAPKLQDDRSSRWEWGKRTFKKAFLSVSNSFLHILTDADLIVFGIAHACRRAMRFLCSTTQPLVLRYVWVPSWTLALKWACFGWLHDGWRSKSPRSSPRGTPYQQSH